jgi:RNA repair pathway DNA polymerase beta family
MTLLMKHVGGSRMYGLNHPQSDWDIIEVHDTLPGRRRNGVICKIEGDLDLKMIDMTTLLNFAYEGQPHALETMFCRNAEEETPMMKFYRRHYRANPAAMDAKYRSVINRLDLTKIKHRRHGIRLALNLASAYRNGGTFNPSLNDVERQTIIEFAEHEAGYVSRLKSLLG